jgi:uncharacterized membrane protein
VNWERLRSYISSGRVFRASTPKVTLVPGAYLNLMLLAPSTSGQRVDVAEFAVSASEELWGQIRVNGTLSGTPTGITAQTLLVGASISPTATVSWSTDGTLPGSGTLYEAPRVGPRRYIDYSEESGPESLEQQMVLAAGNSVLMALGPAAGTLDVSLAVLWRESGS